MVPFEIMFTSTLITSIVILTPPIDASFTVLPPPQKTTTPTPPPRFFQTPHLPATKAPVTRLHVLGGGVVSDGVVDVIGTREIIDGAFWGVGLALSYSLFQKMTSSSLVVPWHVVTTERRDDKDVTTTSSVSPLSVANEGNGTIATLPYGGDGSVEGGEQRLPSNKLFEIADDERSRTTFSGDSWEEISRPENYVLYNKKKSSRTKSDSTTSTVVNEEKRWVIISLLILFVPIFSIEFFLALSRQFMCAGDVFTQPGWARELCSSQIAFDGI